MPAESPTLWLTHLQFEAMLTGARDWRNVNDFALVAMLGLLGLRIFEACNASIGDLGEEHGHRVLRVSGKGGKVVLTPLPPAVARAIDHAVGGPCLVTTGALVVVELKRGLPSDQVVGQTARYMGWVSVHLANGRPVHGIVVAHDADDRLRYAIRSVPNAALPCCSTRLRSSWRPPGTGSNAP